MTFDHLLRRQLQHVLVGALALSAGCTGGDSESLCDEVSAKSGDEGELSREPGYLVVAEGEPCPETPDLSWLQAADCCPVMEPKESCGLANEEVTTQLPYNYGYTTGTGPADPVTVCTYDAVFEANNACCGRPLYVDGDEVVAQTCPGPSDWSTLAEVDAPPEARQAGRAYWLRVAQLEHASVASFGRVALELLRHGAPADLVARCHEAALDEVRHAQLAFGLASALGDGPVRPGPLPLGGAVTLSSTLADLAETLVREGCIGETLAALEAAARLRGAEGAVGDALATIADDEGRHASLAWATLRWLVAVGGDDVVVRAASVFAEGPGATAGHDVPGGRSLGLLTREELNGVHEDAWRSVVAPAWAALVGREAPSGDVHA